MLLCGATTAFAAEVIHSFDSTVRVAKDGELTVTEAIRVEAEGREIRHGIYRDFPLTFKDAGGKVREVDFKLLGVERDGRPERYSTTRQHGVIRIYAGSKDVDVPRGEHTYVFRYRTGRQIRWFDGRPELNWNVTGNFWNFPILAVNYNLELAGGARPLRWTAYTGRLGARGGDWRATNDTSGALMVATTRRLAPGEGLTVVAELPPGAVDPPSESQLLWYRLYDNRAWIFAGIGLLVVLGYYSSRGKQLDAILRAAPSSRCFIRRRIFRRHLGTIFRIGVSAATSGALSRRPPCRSRCAGFCASMTRAAR